MSTLEAQQTQLAERHLNLIVLVLTDPPAAIDYAQDILASTDIHQPDLVRAVAAFNPKYALEMARLLKFELSELLLATL